MISHEIDNLIDDIENHENLDDATHSTMGTLIKNFDSESNRLEVDCIMKLNKLIEKLDGEYPDEH